MTFQSVVGSSYTTKHFIINSRQTCQWTLTVKCINTLHINTLLLIHCEVLWGRLVSRLAFSSTSLNCCLNFDSCAFFMPKSTQSSVVNLPLCSTLSEDCDFFTTFRGATFDRILALWTKYMSAGGIFPPSSYLRSGKLGVVVSPEPLFQVLNLLDTEHLGSKFGITSLWT